MSINSVGSGADTRQQQSEDHLRQRLIEGAAPAKSAQAQNECALHWGMACAGGILAGAGLARGSTSGMLLLGIGGAMLYRSVRALQATPACNWRDVSHPHRPDPVVQINIVDESSWESFPASDAPSANRFTAY